MISLLAYRNWEKKNTRTFHFSIWRVYWSCFAENKCQEFFFLFFLQRAIPILVGTKFDDFIKLPIDLQWAVANQVRLKRLATSYLGLLNYTYLVIKQIAWQALLNDRFTVNKAYISVHNIYQLNFTEIVLTPFICLNFWIMLHRRAYHSSTISLDLSLLIRSPTNLFKEDEPPNNTPTPTISS